MPTLSQHNLALWRRPGDGACGLWSLGTGVGSYGETAFNLCGDSGVHSPIDLPNAPASPALLKKMRSDRRAIAAWLKAPENRYTLRTEHDLWTTNFYRGNVHRGAPPAADGRRERATARSKDRLKPLY